MSESGSGGGSGSGSENEHERDDWKAALRECHAMLDYTMPCHAHTTRRGFSAK